MGWEASIGGFVVGLLIGMTGMGGALIMTPMMIFIFGIHPTLAVGTDLVYACITKIFGSIQHYRQKTIDWTVVKYLCTGSLTGALLGAITIVACKTYYYGSEHMLENSIKEILGITYLIVASIMICRLYIQLAKKEIKAPQITPNTPKKLIFLGIIGGYIVGLTSVGSGTLFIAGLVLIYPLRSAYLVGTDIVQAVIVTGVAGLVHFSVGNVDIRLVGWLLLGSIPGILIGSRITTKVPDLFLRICMIILICLSGFKLLM